MTALAPSSIGVRKSRFTRHLAPLTHPELSFEEHEVSGRLVQIYEAATGADSLPMATDKKWLFEIVAPQSTVDAEQQHTSNVVNYFTQAQKCPWLPAVNSPALTADVVDVAAVLEKVQEQISENGFSFISDAFDYGVCFEKVRLEMLIGLLRGTFLWRNKIDGWKRFLENTRAELKRRRINGDVLLRGLDRD